MKTTKDHIGQFTSYIEDLEKQHRSLKPKLEQITKILSAFGFRVGDPLNLENLPIDASDIEKVKELLKEKGMNIKNFQRALGIFDPTEMTRKRKALVAAKVTRETQNYQGTNATFVELVPGEDEPTAGAGSSTEEAAESSQHGQAEEEITGADPTTVKQAPKKKSN